MNYINEMQNWKQYGQDDAADNLSILGDEFDEWQGPASERWQDIQDNAQDMPEYEEWNSEDWDEAKEWFVAGWLEYVNERKAEDAAHEATAPLCPDCGDPMPAGSHARVCRNCGEDAYDRAVYEAAMANQRQDLAIEAAEDAEYGAMYADCYSRHDRTATEDAPTDEELFHEKMNAPMNDEERVMAGFPIADELHSGIVKPIALTDEERAERKAQRRPARKLPEDGTVGGLQASTAPVENKRAHEAMLRLTNRQDIFDED